MLPGTNLSAEIETVVKSQCPKESARKAQLSGDKSGAMLLAVCSVP